MFIKTYRFTCCSKRILLFACLLLVFWPVGLRAQQNQTLSNGDLTSAITFPGSSCSYKWTIDAPIGNAQSGTGNGIPSFRAVNNGNAPIVARVNAVPQSNGFAYIVNSNTDKVTVLNAISLAVVTKISVGKLPTAVVVSPNGQRVYVVNNFNRTNGVEVGSVSVIDAATNIVISTITVGNNPISAVMSPDGSKLYVAHQNSNYVAVIDAATNTVVNEIKDIENALSITMSVDGTKLFVASDGLGQGEFYAIQVSTGQILYSIPTRLKPTAIVATPDGRNVYVTNGYSNSVSVIDVDYRTIQYLTVGEAPYGIAIAPDGKMAYVANSDDASKSISIINTTTHTVVATVPLASHPFGVAVSPDGENLFITCGSPHEVVVMNTTTRALSAPVAVDPVPVSTGNFVSAGVGCGGFPVNFTITVNPSPTILTSGSIAAMSAIYGSASASKTFNVGGNGLKAGISVTAPAGFEVSTDNVIFTGSVLIGAAGNVPPTQVYIRLKVTAAGSNYVGNVVLSSTDASDVNIAIAASQVTKAPLTITADNKSKVMGDANPPLTFTYSGFVNGDNASVLTVAPVATTTATAMSGLGKYPIKVSGAMAANYQPLYVDGELEVISGAVLAPSAFTPNDDGINDTWDIKFLNLYANCTVEVINRYGYQVYRSTGYAAMWNGKQNGVNLPAGTYYYIINLNNQTKPITGYVAIIR